MSIQRYLPGSGGVLLASRGRITAMFGALVAMNVLVWAWAWALFSDRPTLLGSAFLAYVFGLRHAVDADHIAAIDNVVRKLMQAGQKPFGVGLYFSLGHSTIVVLASVAIAATAKAVQGDSLQAFRETGGVIGTSVSALFLLMIALANVFILKRVWTNFQRARRGERIAADDLDTLLSGHGFLARILTPVFRVVSRSWHMYPLGFLFGLGFDTATEIGVLGISAAQAAQGISIWSILVFPALFTAGMALIDTADSVAMVGAYGWAYVNPIRKLWYNLTITAASVAVAVLIGGIEALGLVGEKFGLKGAFWDQVTAMNEHLPSLGFAVVGIFAACWLVSVALYKWKRYDEIVVTIA
jgi:nickel/cobalt transporter (NiCoT) family protein